MSVYRRDYLSASVRAAVNGIGLNDVLARVLMEDMGMCEIYSFDRDFDRITDLCRVCE
jgi:predicted nucleic acid-binding protein